MNFKEIFIEKNEVKPNRPIKGILEYWLINKNTPSENVSLALVNLEKNISSGDHSHSVEEIFYFLKGAGKIIVGEKEQNIKPGLCVYIPKNVSHNIISTEEESIEVLAVLGGTNVKTKSL